MPDQRTRLVAIAGAVAAVLAVAGGVATVRALTGPPLGSAVGSLPRGLTEPSLELTCASGMISSGTLDFVGPGSAAEGEAQGWPTSPEAAAQATFSSPMFMAVRLRDLTMRDGVTVELPNGAPAVQFPATAGDGSTQGLITVEQVIDGYWSATQIASCG